MKPTLCFLFLASAALAQTGFVPLFNGKNLDGWEVDTPGLWQARDGMIIGQSPGLKYNDFLRTKKHYSNFVLKVSFQMVDGKGNSGVQFRSKPVPNTHEVSGYQADIGEQYWGCLYDESRRKRVLVWAKPEHLTKLNKGGWNQYVITARGNHITLELNGARTVDYTESDADIETTGFLALQLHAGAPMEMRFKDLQIRELK